MTNSVIAARALLEEAKLPVSGKVLLEKTGINRDELAALVKNNVLNAWHKLIRSVPEEFFSKNFAPGGPMAAQAREIVEFMLKNSDKIMRRDQICDVLGFDLGTGQYVFSTLESHGLVESFYSMCPENDCQICFYRGKCKKDVKPSTCRLFRDDWKLAVSANGGMNASN